MLEIIFHTKTYTSAITKRPKIQTNEGQPDKFVSIASNVTARPDSTYPIIIKPYKVDLSQFTDKLIDEAEVTITNVSDQELTLSLVSSPVSLCSIKLPETIKPGESATGVVKLNEDKIAEAFEKSFTIQLNDEKKTRFTVPVKRIIRNTGGQVKLDLGK